jgi:hypothetical protein
MPSEWHKMRWAVKDSLSRLPYPGAPGSCRTLVHLFTLGFTRRLALQLGHRAFMRAVSLSLRILA